MALPNDHPWRRFKNKDTVFQRELREGENRRARIEAWLAELPGSWPATHVANDKGESLIHTLVLYWQPTPEALRILDALLERGVPLDGMNQRGHTPLSQAIGWPFNRWDWLGPLLDRGADASVPDVDGQLPVARAMEAWLSHPDPSASLQDGWRRLLAQTQWERGSLRDSALSQALEWATRVPLGPEESVEACRQARAKGRAAVHQVLAAGAPVRGRSKRFGSLLTQWWYGYTLQGPNAPDRAETFALFSTLLQAGADPLESPKSWSAQDQETSLLNVLKHQVPMLISRYPEESTDALRTLEQLFTLGYPLDAKDPHTGALVFAHWPRCLLERWSGATQLDEAVSKTELAPRRPRL